MCCARVFFAPVPANKHMGPSLLTVKKGCFAVFVRALIPAHATDAQTNAVRRF
jgi:hypothetical protein